MYCQIGSFPSPGQLEPIENADERSVQVELKDDTSKNMDFVNISALDNEISNSNSENQIPNPIEEERNTNSMSNTTSFNEPQPQNNTQLANNNNISKVKYGLERKGAIPHHEKHERCSSGNHPLPLPGDK